jgi:3-hydroxyisobutyrate dehydrogenase-like beta-hydroxyacid dehydrogenase
MLNFRKIMKQLIIGSAMLGLCSAVAHSEATASAENVSAVIEHAVEMQQQARSAGHGWTITADYISQAKSDLLSGDLDSAMAAAERALLTASKSVEQAEAEKSAWQARVPTL